MNFVVVVLKLKYSLVLQHVYQKGFTCSWTWKPELPTGDPCRLREAIFPEKLQICVWTRTAIRESDEAALHLFDDMLRKSCLVGSRKRLNDEIIKHGGVKYKSINRQIKDKKIYP